MALFELVERRTRTAKHYLDTATGQIVARLTIHDQHVESVHGSGVWDIDASEALEAEDHAADGVTYRRVARRLRHVLRVAEDGERRWYPRRHVADEYVAFGRLQYESPAGSGSYSNLTMGTPAISGNAVTWDRPGYSVKLVNIWRRVKIELVLKSSAYARRLRWPVSLTGLRREGERLISIADGMVVGYVDRPVAWDATGSHDAPNVPISLDYLDGCYYLTANLAGAVYPVTLDPTFTDGPGGDVTTSWDGRVRESAADTAYATATTVTLYGGAGSRSFMTLKFDVSSLNGSTVTSSSFSLFNENTKTSDRNATLSSLLAANSGMVEACTWNYANPTSVRWAGDTGGDGGSDAGGSVSGTDFNASALGSLSYIANTVAGTEHPVSLAVAQVQDWVDGANYGALLWTSEASDSPSWCTSDHATAGYRPSLTVVYEAGGGSATLAATLATATASSPSAALAGGASLAASLPTASALSPVSTLRGQVVLAGALASASALSPTATLLAGARLNASLPTATAGSPAAVLVGGATLAASLATADALGPAGALTGGALLQAALVTALASSPAATLLGTGSAALVAALATASADSPAASLLGGALLGAVLAEATATSPAAALSGASASTLLAALCLATATSPSADLLGGATLLAALAQATAGSPDATLLVRASLLAGLPTALAASPDAALLGGATFEAALATATARALVAVLFTGILRHKSPLRATLLTSGRRRAGLSDTGQRGATLDDSGRRRLTLD